MTSFNDYWKEKAAKRRKSWTSKVQRFARKHSQLEDMRKEAFLPLDYTPGFEFDDYKKLHFVGTNPIIVWQQGVFSFSEEGLRKALTTEGADLSTFKMEVSSQHIHRNKAPEPDITWRGICDMHPNKVLDYEEMYHNWLKKVYQINTYMETVHICYGQISMTIRRYSSEGRPFGYYELIPCEQLTKAAILFQETDFYTFNVATMLMEAAAEWDLRQEELNYYAKKQKLRTMEAATTESIEFELWDDKKLQKKIQEYIGKDYQIVKILEQVLRPWKMGIKKYINAATERALNEQVLTFQNFNYWNKDMFWEKELVPYLNSVGLQDMETKDKLNITIKSKGFQCSITKSGDGIRLCPNSLYKHGLIDLSPQTPLSAIGEYLKKMPELSQRMEEEIIKTIQIYDQQMMQKPEYRHFVETIESLGVQNAGKPVGKLMKYLRWDAGRLYTTRFSPSTIKIKSDTAFSYEDKKCYKGVVSNGVYTLVKDKYPERWVDAECRQVFIFDPVTTDIDAWLAANRHGIGDPKYEWKVGEFICSFMPIYSTPFISFDFIDQKL